MSADRSPDTIADHYVHAHDRIVGIVTGLDADRALTPVPATPLWTVHDVLAHLVSIPAEIAGGKLTGIPTPEQTQAQVDQRRGRGIAALLEEWEQGFGPLVEATRAGLIPAPLAVDAITHEQDIRGALGTEPVPDAAAVRWAALGYSLSLRSLLQEAGLGPLRLHDPDTGFDVIAGKGEPDATVTAPVFDFFRAMGGRRSRAQVAAFAWDGDREPYLDAFCIFGPLREQDLHDA